MIDRWQEAIAVAEAALRGDTTSRERAATVTAELSEDTTPLGRSDLGRRVSYLVSLLEALGLAEEAGALLKHVTSRLVWDPAALSLPHDVRNELAVTLADRGHVPAAVTLLSTAVTLSSRDAMRPTPDVPAARTLANLAALKLRLGDEEGAKSAAGRALLSLHDRDDAPPEQSEIRLLAETVLCELSRRQGDDATADRRVNDLAHTARRLMRQLGGEHPASLSALITLARAQFVSALCAGDRERQERCVGVLSVAAQKAAATLGPGHPLSRSAQVNLADVELEAARMAGDLPRIHEAQALLPHEDLRRAAASGQQAVARHAGTVRGEAGGTGAVRGGAGGTGMVRGEGGGTGAVRGEASGSVAAPAKSLTGRRGNRQSRAGIRDVAAAAGVSITTVSDALNGKGRLPDATRRHVREVAERLGYRPTAASRTLRTGRSGLIGLTMTMARDADATTDSTYFAEVTTAATAVALSRGYALVTLPAPSRHNPIDVWSNVALDGTVVIRPSDHDPLVSELVRQGLPVVSDGRPAGSLPVTAWVDNDHEAAVLEILDHLAAAGARRIGLLTGTTTDTYTHLSTTAYLRWCERVGQDPVYESYPAHDPCAGAVAADRLLARPDRPDAVYGLFDPNGTDLLAAARRYGLRVPDDLLLVCCSESTVYATTEPPITTLSLKPRRIGTAVVQLLIDAIEGLDSGRPVEQVIPTELIVRTSSERRPREGREVG